MTRESLTLAGQVLLGKYKVTRQLDLGGMSTIYLARQLDANRDVVVKVLQLAHRSNPKTREHFRREIHIMSRFQHPNAVAYYDADPNHPGGPILVMEYLRGQDLGLLLHKQGRLNPEWTGRLLAQLCDVLQTAHDAGIIHRDLKPGNLMIVSPTLPVETLKLMDFGLAKMNSMLYISADELHDWSLPPTAGTPEYICPEQVRAGAMDYRGDLYSVGVILYEMLTGKRPFERASARDLMLAHLDEAPPSFADLGLPYLVPPTVEKVVMACLAKHPEDRPKNAMEIAIRYEHALGKRINIRRASPANTSMPGSNSGVPRDNGSQPGSNRASTLSAVGLHRTDDRNSFQQSIEAAMPEAMAILKVKGFICDLGGEVVDSVPGMVKVRVPEPQTEEKKGGIFGWARPVAAVQSATEVELHMEKRDPTQPSKMTITLVMRPPAGLVTAEWQTRCQKIGRDLQAYLMGR